MVANNILKSEVISRMGSECRTPFNKISVHFGGHTPEIVPLILLVKYTDIASNILYCIIMMNFLTATWKSKSF